MKISFNKSVSLDKMDLWRSRYLETLSESQEQYLEFLIKDAAVYLIEIDGKEVGYFIINEDKFLLEYFLLPAVIQFTERVFSSLIETLNPELAYCKSFDSLLLSTAMEFKRSVDIVGVNFRSNHLEDTFSERRDISARPANEDDKEILWELREEIFDTMQEIEEFIEKKQVFLFEQKGKTQGLGIFSEIISTRPEHDIGMAVSPDFRKQGTGTYIINYLREHCRKNFWIPVCGCGKNNIGSRMALQKAGFVPLYRVLEFRF